ncbi:hypothetical protein QCA50_018279 [Cerrena zonata]|uniref:Uncharacterized protein n=1 Tax=Cerrena zonata TaxID=2478898 RepID=A0AAW0FER9_9APHY
MKFSRAALATTFATLMGMATADLQVTAPSSSVWWVAQSINTIAWTCDQSQFQNFTILIANSDPKVLVSPLAIVAVENNFDCSKTITQEQSSQPAASGYTILLANPLNSSQVYATSEPFEIKALGAAYPTTTVAPGSSTATSSGSSPSSSTGSDQTTTSGNNNAASGLKASTSVAGAAAMGLAVLGYFLA